MRGGKLPPCLCMLSCTGELNLRQTHSWACLLSFVRSYYKGFAPKAPVFPPLFLESIVINTLQCNLHQSCSSSGLSISLLFIVLMKVFNYFAAFVGQKLWGSLSSYIARAGKILFCKYYQRSGRESKPYSLRHVRLQRSVIGSNCLITLQSAN